MMKSEIDSKKMDSYRIEWKKSALKELQKLHKSVIPRILDAVEQLAEEPHPAGSRKLQKSKSHYRIRVGVYRIIYSVFKNRLIIEIIRIGHRKDIYRL